ncbi:MAG: hypothetical protein K6T16_03200 [Candidatus Pacearchaeota archaeon]|nr:hypothetical protein [Candidatus Pacearchaeota archaeon]
MKKVAKSVKGKSERHNIIEIIGMSFKNWWQNLIIIPPFVFNILASGVGVLLLFLLFSLVFVAAFGPVAMETLKEIAILSATSDMTGAEPAPETINTLLTLLSEPSIVFFLITTVIVAVIALGLVKAFFYTGAIAMSSEIFGGNKTSLRTMTTAGKRFLWRYWAVEVVMALAAIAWLFVFSLPLIFSQNIVWLLLPILGAMPLVFVYVLFALSGYYVVLENLGVWKAFGRSFEVVKKNYWATIGLGLLFILMNSFVGVIPWVGGLINLLVVLPCQTIAFVIFAIERLSR